MSKNETHKETALKNKIQINLPVAPETLLTAAAIRAAATDYVKTLDERSRRVVTRRFGLDGQDAKTLHAIGQDEGVTRERIRQIEQTVLKHFNSDKRNSPEFAAAKKVQENLSQIILALGGITREELLADLLKLKNSADIAALSFLLKCLPGITEARESNRYRHHYRHLEHVDLDKIITAARELLKEQKKLQSDADFFDKIRQRCGLNAANQVLYAVLTVTHDLVRTSFGEWGMRGWVEATPRGVGDKAYVMLKRDGKPQHFLHITDLINSAEFDRRIAHPQTVHNELIRDDRFILVGRGMYALKEWGYQAGTVGDVLERIIKKNQRAMLKEDLIDAVLKERIVKRNTILLALQNRKKFFRNSDGRYGLTDQEITQQQKQIINNGETVAAKTVTGDNAPRPKAEELSGGSV